MKKILFLKLFLILILNIHCNGSNLIYIDSYGMKITSGDFKAYEFTNGTKGMLLDEKKLESGVIDLNPGNSNSNILIELTNASFTNISTGKTTTFGSNHTWSTIITLSENNSSKDNPLQINPLTSIGTALAKYKITYSLEEEESIIRSKNLIGDHFKLDINKSPALTEESSENTSLDYSSEENLPYFLAIAGLSQLAKELSYENNVLVLDSELTILDITQLLIEDILYDGILNGFSRNGLITIGNYIFSAKTLKDDLVDAIEKYMSEKGIQETPAIFALIQSLSNNNSEIFLTSGDLDFDPPQITLLEPSEYSFLHNQARLFFQVSDQAEIESIMVYVYDSNQILIEDLDFDPNFFDGFINTNFIPDGPFYIRVIIRDINGNFTDEILNFYADNSGPGITSNLYEDMVARSTIEIQVVANDLLTGAGTDQVNIKIDNTYINNGQRINETHFIFEFDTFTYSDGYHVFTIEAIDILGNINYAEHTILINNVVLSFNSYVSNNGEILSGNYSTEYVGDLNNDGFPDIINTRHRLYNNMKVHLGDQDPNYQTSFDFIDNDWDLTYGVSIAGNCDIDADGYIDTVAGPTPHTLRSSFTAYLGPFDSNDGWANSIEIPSPIAFDMDFGTNVQCLDVNGDNYADIITNDGSSNTTWIYFGPDLDSYISISAPDYKIIKVGDIDNDDVNDFIIGNRLFYGSSDNSFTRFTDISLPFNSAIGLGDVNSDGYDDIAIGDKYNIDPDQQNFGVAKILFGGTQFPNDFVPFEVFPPYACENFGAYVAGGDIDGDGNRDLIVSSPNNNVNAHENAGEIFIFFGPSFQDFRSIISSNPQRLMYFGTNIRSGFDLNLDGRDDLITQEPSVPGILGNTGSFYVFYDL